MINVFSDKRGSTPIPTAILVLIVSLIISVVMFFSYVQTQTIVVRNAMKTGLANLAITISEDTYTALRESNFDEYIDRLTSLSSYRRKLTNTYINDISNVVPLDTDKYKVDSIELIFNCEGRKIRYTCVCDVTYYVTILGINLPAVARSVQVEGSHTAKYGR